MFIICRQVGKSLRLRGVPGTILHTGRYIIEAGKRLTPASRRVRRQIEAQDREFDRCYGVDTHSIIPLEAFSIQAAERDQGNPYEPITPSVFRSMLRNAGDTADWTFVDFGSGKGRALLLAAEFPFARIIGVEFAPELVEICRRNLEHYSNPDQVCRKVEVWLGNAAEFELSAEPLVLFLFNPFGEAVMSRVVTNVRRSLKANPRSMTVLYVNPIHRGLWSAAPEFERQPSTESYTIYRNRAGY